MPLRISLTLKITRPRIVPALREASRTLPLYSQAIKFLIRLQLLRLDNGGEADEVPLARRQSARVP